MNQIIKPVIIFVLTTILIGLMFYIFKVIIIKPTPNSSSIASEQLHETYTKIKWHDYNDKAVQEAISENKLIFLHITNPSCLECQFMQQDSFQNADIIKKMNQLFINIRVDNEVNPDVYHIFSITEYIFSQTQGLPLNVILTPDFKPIFIISTTNKENLQHLFDDITNAWEQQKNNI